MAYKEDKIKQLYDESASLIAILGAKQMLNTEEMMFLLNLLDYIFSAEKNPAFFETVKLWAESIDNKEDNENKEIDQIIKATLLTIDFTDAASVNEVIKIMRDLYQTRANNNSGGNNFE